MSVDKDMMGADVFYVAPGFRFVQYDVGDDVDDIVREGLDL